MTVPALSSSSEASLDPARTQKRSSPSPSALSSKSRGEQSFNQASIILSLDLAEARNPLLSLTGCREKGFNGHRRVERNESLTLQERGFFFILFLCHIKRALDSYKMLCNHFFAARWESSGGSLSHLPSLLQACCAPELWDRAKKQTLSMPKRSCLPRYRDASGTTEGAGLLCTRSITVLRSRQRSNPSRAPTIHPLSVASSCLWLSLSSPQAP